MYFEIPNLNAISINKDSVGQSWNIYWDITQLSWAEGPDSITMPVTIPINFLLFSPVQ